MKKETTNKHRIYLKTLLDLRAIIDQEFNDGGWLPSERIMCERLNVSRMTYRKVLGWLISEGIIRSVPRKGHWVLEKDMRCRKVGIIIGNGTESPFISYGNFLARVLDTLQENRLKAHLIQASRLDNINISAMSHAVEGIIWIHPPLEAFDYIRQIQDEGIPVISVSHKIEEGKPVGVSRSLKDIIYVALDFVDSTRIAAEKMIERGYRRIVFLCSGDYDVEQALLSTFNEAGIKFSRNHILYDIDGLEDKLETINRRIGIDAVFADGGWDRIEKLFNFYRKLPVDKRPDLILPKADNVIGLYKKSQDIDITGYQIFGNMHLAETATEMMVQNLNNGRPMTSLLSPAYHIVFENKKLADSPVNSKHKDKSVNPINKAAYELAFEK